MKKRITVLLSALISLSASACVWAGAFDEYYDYENPDGTYTYFFDQDGQDIFVTLDQEWYQNTFVKTGDSGATFYHKDSYDAYEKEGYEGGRLFTIGASVNSSFQELPSFVYIGFDDESCMNYYAELPTDYQGYYGDESIRAEYDSLWSGVKDVVALIRIGSGTQSDSTPATTDYSGLFKGASLNTQIGNIDGGWTITEDTALTDDAKDVFQKALPSHDRLINEPVALLGTQVVAGTNYCFLYRAAEDAEDGSTSYKLAYIWQAPGEEPKILEIQDLNIGLSESDG